MADKKGPTGFSRRSATEPDGYSKRSATEDDVEGHRFRSGTEPTGFSKRSVTEPDGFSKRSATEDDDVEGHSLLDPFTAREMSKARERDIQQNLKRHGLENDARAAKKERR